MEIAERALAWPNKAKALVIVDAASYEVAGEHLVVIKALRKEIANTCDPVIEAAYQSHKAAVAMRKEAEAPLIEAENIIKTARTTFAAEEAKRKGEAERVARETAKRAEEERLLAEALDAEKDGDTATAESILSEGVFVPTIAGAPLPKTAGISSRKVWKFRVIDATLIPREYMVPNEKAIGGVVRAMRTMTNIPGIEVYYDETEAVR